jgi:cytochrome c biogenesis protein CcmG/thiol:disulfide interchange protein DsbE
MTDFGPRTLRQRLFALLGVGAIVGVVLAGLWAAGVFKSTAGEAATLVETPAVAGVSEVGPLAGQVAPDFELTDFGGNRHRLSDYRGKVVYVNFWATWCVPCQAELPEIYALQQEYGDRLQVIEVDRGETADKASKFLDGVSRLDGGTGVSFGVNGIDPTEALYKRYETLPIQVTPISIFIDARGVVTTLYNGQLQAGQMHTAAEKALAGDESGS